MYSDESGDVGTRNSPSNYFVLSSLIIHEANWLPLLDDLIDFRRALKNRYELLMSEEIHASEFINGRLSLQANIARNDRLDLLKKCLKWLSLRNDISLITVRVLKVAGNDVFDYAWRTFIQRFENTLKHRNFPGGVGADTGIIIADNTDGGKLRSLLREMRRYNQVPNTAPFGGGARNMKLRDIIEDPVLRDSKSSYIHQMIDVVVYFARQYYEPNRYIRRKGARTFYSIVEPATNPHVTKYKTPYNIVEL